MSHMLSKIVLSIALTCMTSLTFAVSKYDVIKFRNTLSELVSMTLDKLEKKRPAKGFGPAEEKVLVSKVKTFIDLGISLALEVQIDLDADVQLMHILQYDLKKFCNALEAKDVKKIKWVSNDIMSQLNNIIARIK